MDADTFYKIGNPQSDIVLLQPVDEHDLEGIENEYAEIVRNCKKEFCLNVVRIADWNNELSPWKAPAIFGKEGFGGGALKTLGELIDLCADKRKTYYIGGYSLAGLFALWAAYQTNLFSGVAAASPSLWFPEFDEYMINNEIKTDTIYLSLGDREEKTRNPVMATVGDKIRKVHTLFKEDGVDCVLEWNDGNHFKDADIRMAKAFAWVINNRLS